MKLRTLSLSFSALAAMLILVSGIAISSAYLQFNTLRSANTLANELLGESEQLVNVTLDYLLFQESRSEIQWRSKYQQMGVTLQKFSARNSQKDESHLIEETLARVGRVFERLVAAPEEQLRELSAQVSLHLFELQNHIRNENFRLGQEIDAAIDRLVVTGLSALVVLVLFILFNLIFVFKRVLLPIQRQEHEIAKVTDSNLSYELNLPHRDEISSLSDALKLMIAKRHFAELELRETNETLKAANAELESFAYIASHDLKAPLRGIKSLVSLLTREVKGELSADAQRYLDLMVNRTERMQALLEGLLQYSRIGRKMEEAESIDCAALIAEIVSLNARGEHWKVITPPSLPTIYTQKAPLELVLRNLIDNAIKHHDKDAGQVVISTKEQGDRVIFTVEDDGPGIEPEYQERIFKIFHTLKPRDEVEGSGLGLALVQKTVEHFGGRVRVESDPKLHRGTKFIFDWPKHE